MNINIPMYVYVYIYIDVAWQVRSDRSTMLVDLVCRKFYNYVHAYQRVAVVTYIYIILYYGGRYLPSSAAVDVRRLSGRSPDAFVWYIAFVFSSVWPWDARLIIAGRYCEGVDHFLLLTKSYFSSRQTKRIRLICVLRRGIAPVTHR